MDLWVRDKFQTKYDPATSRYYHTIIGNYISIDNDEIGEFLDMYCESVHTGNNPHISEIVKGKDYLPLGFDLALKFEQQQIKLDLSNIESVVRAIDKYVEQVIDVIQTMMQNHFILDNNGSEKITIYLRNPEPLQWRNNRVEYTGRLIFPYAHLHTTYITKFYDFVVNQLQLNGLTPDNVGLASINGLDTFIRPRIDELLDMYGSTRDEAIPALKIYKIFGMLNTDIRTEYEISSVFQPHFNSMIYNGILSPELVAKRQQEKGIDYWTPLFLSSYYYEYPVKLKPGMTLELSEPPKITISVIKENGESLSKLERARKLLSFISFHRMDHYWSWIDVGQALKSVDPSEGLKLWKWFTTQSDYKTDMDCDMLWPTFDGTECVDIETLEYFASKDSPGAYEQFRAPEIRDALEKAISEQEHTPIAQAFHTCFPHDFVCSNYNTGEWFVYNGVRWVSMSGNVVLMKWIINKFKPKLEQMQRDISKDIEACRDVTRKDMWQLQLRNICELIKKLNRNPFKRSICDELKVLYHREEFYARRDKHRDYTVCQTVVIDIRGGEVAKRPGKPQDWCTRYARYDPLDATWEHPSVVATMNYLRQVFPNARLLQYVLRFLACLLKSGNSDKIFPILSGEGNNSKSVLVKLIETALGTYAVHLPTSLITGKPTGADTATPTLIYASGAKIAFLEEPNKAEQIQSGTVKRYTGDDKNFGRDLFQKGSEIVEIYISVIICLICNEIPTIPDCQQAIWNRTRVIDFISEWRLDAPDSIEEQFRTNVFKMDPYFDVKLPMMAPALLWIMCQMYPEYHKNGLQDPPEVMQATENFRVTNNFYIAYFRDCIKAALADGGAIDDRAFITLDEMYAKFREWYKDQQRREKVPIKSEFKKNIQLVMKVKADPDNKWYGLQMIETKNSFASLLI